MKPLAVPDLRRRAWLRRTLRPLAAAPLLAGGLAACSLDSAPRIDYHPLRDLGGSAGVPAGTAASDKVMLLASAATSTLYDTDRMVFSADGRTRSYFQYGFWAQLPARGLLTLAEQRLQRSGLFSAVALSTSAVRGDWLLTLRLDELYLDDAASPALARLVFNADLVDWRAHRLLARRAFEGAQPVASRNASGLAQAANQAMTQLLGELAAWVGSQAKA